MVTPLCCPINVNPVIYNYIYTIYIYIYIFFIYVIQYIIDTLFGKVKLENMHGKPQWTVYGLFTVLLCKNIFNKI